MYTFLYCVTSIIFMQLFDDESITEQIAGQYFSLYLSKSLQVNGGEQYSNASCNCCQWDTTIGTNSNTGVGKKLLVFLFHPYQGSG